MPFHARASLLFAGISLVSCSVVLGLDVDSLTSEAAGGAPVAGARVGGGVGSGAATSSGGGGMAAVGSAGTYAGGGSNGAQASSGGAGAAGDDTGGGAPPGTCGDAGCGGQGSGQEVPSCAGQPALSRAGWSASASRSHPYNPPELALDGDSYTSWQTGKLQSGDEWFELDFGESVVLNEVTIEIDEHPNDYPRQFSARLSETSGAFDTPVLATGSGTFDTPTAVSFSGPVAGRYLLLTQEGTANDAWWSISELRVACTGQ